MGTTSSRPAPPLSGFAETRPGGLLSGSMRPARPWLRWLAVVGWVDLVLALAGMQAPRWPVDPLWAFTIAFTAVCTSTLATAFAAPPVSRRALPLALLPGAALGAVWLAGGSGLMTAMTVTAALLLGGTLVGAAVGRSIAHPGHLIFVWLVSSAADVFSVFHPSGPSQAIVESEQALSVLALPWPMLGGATIAPLLGVGDVVFTALYAACALRHGLGAKRTALALALGYALTMLAVIGLQTPVPALPVLGAAVVFAHPAARKPPPGDRARGWFAVAVIVAAVLAMFFL